MWNHKNYRYVSFSRKEPVETHNNGEISLNRSGIYTITYVHYGIIIVVGIVGTIFELGI